MEDLWKLYARFMEVRWKIYGGFMKHLWRVSGCFLARWCGEVSLVEFWVVCLISVRLLADFVVLKCFWWNSGWWISGGFCGSGWFVVEVWVDWWNSGGISGEFLWLKVSGGFLVDFVALGCFWWNSWWSGGHQKSTKLPKIPPEAHQNHKIHQKLPRNPQDHPNFHHKPTRTTKSTRNQPKITRPPRILPEPTRNPPDHPEFHQKHIRATKPTKISPGIHHTTQNSIRNTLEPQN
jgi:hypothetical protein